MCDTADVEVLILCTCTHVTAYAEMTNIILSQAKDTAPSTQIGGVEMSAAGVS